MVEQVTLVMTVQIHNGLACRECGCTDTQIVEADKRWGRPWVRLFCNECFLSWTEGVYEPEEVNGAVEYKLTPCPGCGTTDISTETTRRPQNGYRIRYHRCNDSECEFNKRLFKSAEKVRK